MPTKDALKAPRRQLEKFKRTAREHEADFESMGEHDAERVMKQLAKGKPIPHKPPAKS